MHDLNICTYKYNCTSLHTLIILVHESFWGAQISSKGLVNSCNESYLATHISYRSLVSSRACFTCITLTMHTKILLCSNISNIKTDKHSSTTSTDGRCTHHILQWLTGSPILPIGPCTPFVPLSPVAP